MISIVKKHIVVTICFLSVCNYVITQGENNTARRVRNPLNIKPEDLTNIQFYNKQAFIDVCNLIASRLDSKRPLVILIDGNSRVGKTTLARDIGMFFLNSYGITSQTIHMDDFLTIEEMPPSYIAYAEQFGSIFDFDTLIGLKNSWDYSKATEAVLDAISTGEDIVILEGLNAGYIAKLDYVKFDLKIHIQANQQTREHIYKLTFPEEECYMESYLSRYTTRYDISDMNYDLIIQNNLLGI